MASPPYIHAPTLPFQASSSLSPLEKNTDFLALAGDMLNRSSTNEEDNVTPFPDMEPVAAHRPVTRLVIPTTDEIVPPVDTSDLPPTLTPRTTSQHNRPVFHGTSSSYWTTEFLKSCFICRKALGEMVDIFMYKDRSFCSDACRNKQMDKDREEEMKKLDNRRNNKRSRKNPPPKGNENTIFFISDD